MNISESQELMGRLKPGDWIFLHGDLGAGKTFFTQRICREMGVLDVVSSPTYALMNIYNANYNGIEKILHLDLYRLKTPLEICSLGLEQEFDTLNTIAFFEWPSILNEQDWEHFFQFTGCPRPLRTHNIHVSQFTRH